MGDELTNHEAFCLIAAVRYACGRESYAPGIVITEVRRLLPRIPVNDRATIARDIRGYALDRAHCASAHGATDAVADGRNWYRADWEQLASELEAANV